ncbi:chromate reductase [Roseivivax halodurans JCM 10272]|uniref:Chromate reductase n=1 Tax=Roseivivax halodurans JCM 10272 TaxID=1449350 RepID=X7EE43_9RHOB|nr:NADPH-dependent FMN reductase [Roseivivax halodurans]ETX13456.1 chromate reductase [Roseivivax halodurans JCM 10272]
MTELLFIPGSLRAASASRATARALIARLPAAVSARTADPGLLPHYNADLTNDAHVAAFVAQVGQADGIVFVTPEYNYSIPGLLKNAIDWASRPAYASVFKDKPCLVVTVSGGPLGGVRAQSHLKYVLNGMLARVHPSKEILVPQANAKIENGTLVDEAILDFAGEILDDFASNLAIDATSHVTERPPIP